MRRSALFLKLRGAGHHRVRVSRNEIYHPPSHDGEGFILRAGELRGAGIIGSRDSAGCGCVRREGSGRGPSAIGVDHISAGHGPTTGGTVDAEDEIRAKVSLTVGGFSSGARLRNRGSGGKGIDGTADRSAKPFSIRPLQAFVVVAFAQIGGAILSKTSEKVATRNLDFICMASIRNWR
jgi:hypothetical protein